MDRSESGFFTCEELARRWSKSKKWVYNNWRSRGIPVCHIGQHLRFPVNGIKEWEESNTH
jgi:hypothetical protein